VKGEKRFLHVFVIGTEQNSDIDIGEREELIF